jgi:methyltransferase (TIGR00027 family)
MANDLVSNVSDTAKWVAHYRATESARSDALFRDPFASALAGDQGRAISDAARRSMGDGWPIVIRTKLIDDLVMTSIREGCDRVLNLAAGLDTRPHRLKLPETLEWIEADLPAVVDAKNAFFSDTTPACKITREKVDLTDHAARRAFLERAIEGANKVLVLTEGLLVYLEEPTVKALSSDFAAQTSIAYWMFDLAAPAILRMMNKTMDLANAPTHFAPENGVAFFEALGWKVLDCESVFGHARQLKRLPGFLRVLAALTSFLPKPNPRSLGKHARWSGIVRLARK